MHRSYYTLVVVLLILYCQPSSSQTWTLLQPPERPLSDLHGLWFHSRDTGWICGTRGGVGRLYHSIDAGSTWTIVALPSSPAPLNDIRFKDRRNGVVAGDAGYVASTSDGGRSWAARPVDAWNATVDVNSILMVDSATWVVVGQVSRGSGPRMARTVDAGLTWQQIPLTGPANNLHDIESISPVVAIAVGTGTPPRRSVSVDGGVTWEANSTMALAPPVSGTSLSFYDIAHDPWSGTTFVAGGKVFALPQWSEVRTSTDGGTTWQGRAMSGASSVSRRPAGSVAPVGDRALFVPTRGGMVWRSLDGGLNWTQESLPTQLGSKDLRRSQILSSNDLYVVGMGGVILHRTLLPALNVDKDTLVIGAAASAPLSIVNSGDGLLHLDSAQLIQPSNTGVRLRFTQPFGAGQTIYPSYSTQTLLSVSADTAAQPGIYTGRIRLFTNAGNHGMRGYPFDIPVQYARLLRALQVNNGIRSIGPIRVDPNISALLTLDNVLENVGNETVSILNVRLARGTDFVLLAPSGQTAIPAGRGLSIMVDFRPTRPCDHFDTVIVEHDAATPGSPIRIPIRGRGVEPSIQVTPRDTIDFGGVLVGGFSVDTLNIANAEPNTCLDSTFVDTLYIIGPQRTEFTTQTLIRRGDRIAPMSRISAPITARPLAKGQRVAQAVIRHELSAGIPDTVMLLVNGLLPELTTVQPEIIFHITDVGGVRDTTAQDFLQNLSNADVAITTASIVGLHPADFSYVGPATEFSLPSNPRPGYRQSIRVRFTPTAPGVRQAVLRFGTSAGDKDVILRGRADSALIDSRLSVILFLPETPVGRCRDTTVQRVVFNRGSTPLRIRSAEIGADPAAPGRDDSLYFSIISPTIPPEVTLQPGDSIAFSLRFCPQRPGVHLARLILQTNAMQGLVSTQLTAVANGGNVVARDSIQFASTRSLTVRDTTADAVIVNHRTMPLRVNSITIGGADPTSFQILDPATPFVLDTGEAMSVTLRFAPKRRDRHLATLFVHHEFGVEATTLIGRSPYPLLEIRPSAQSSLRTRLGQVRKLALLVTNIGDDTSHIASLSIVGSPAYTNATVVLLPRVLSVGDSLAMNVDFTPSILCDDSATISVRAEGVSGVYGLSDTSVGFAGIGVSPFVSTRATHISFGPRNVGGDYDTVTTDFVGNTDFSNIVDSCIEATTLDSIIIVGRDAGSFSIQLPIDPLNPRPLGAGILQPVDLRFSPRSFGLKQAELRIYFDGSGDSVRIVELFGSGSSLPVQYGPYPGMTDVDFGALRLGWERDSILTVTNTATSPISIDQMDLTSSSEFRILSPSLPLILQPGVPVEVHVRYAPAASFGLRRAFLRIRSGANADSSFFLTGSALASTFRMIPDTIDFARRIPPGPYDSSSQAVNQPNGAVPMAVLDSVVLERAQIVFGAPDFSITRVPITLLPGTINSVGIRFAPSGPVGRRSGVARIYYDRHVVNGVEVVDSTDLVLFGTVDRGRIDLHVDPGPNISASPGDVVRVPVTITGDPSFASVDSLDLRVRFRRSMLRPVRVIPAPGVQSTLMPVRGLSTVDAVAVVRLVSSGSTLTSGVVADVEFTVLLGDALTSIVAIDSSGIQSHPEIAVTGDSMRFSVDEFCDASGRLVSFGLPIGIKAIPNPVNAGSELEYTVPALERVRISLYDAVGREVARLVDGERRPGRYVLKLDVADLPTGAYQCILLAGRFTASLTLFIAE